MADYDAYLIDSALADLPPALQKFQGRRIVDPDFETKPNLDTQVCCQVIQHVGEVEIDPK